MVQNHFVMNIIDGGVTVLNFLLIKDLNVGGENVS